MTSICTSTSSPYQCLSPTTIINLTNHVRVCNCWFVCVDEWFERIHVWISASYPEENHDGSIGLDYVWTHHIQAWFEVSQWLVACHKIYALYKRCVWDNPIYPLTLTSLSIRNDSSLKLEWHYLISVLVIGYTKRIQYSLLRFRSITTWSCQLFLKLSLNSLLLQLSIALGWNVVAIND